MISKIGGAVLAGICVILLALVLSDYGETDPVHGGHWGLEKSRTSFPSHLVVSVTWAELEHEAPGVSGYFAKANRTDNDIAVPIRLAEAMAELLKQKAAANGVNNWSQFAVEDGQQYTINPP